MGNIMCQSQAILAVALVDYLTCYDSIAHPPSSIACQQLGIFPIVLETISSIQQMHISLCTMHGDSTSTYDSSLTSTLPFQGVCQSNGASLALWLATSILLIKML